MPDLEEHSKHSKERYGVEGRDIHSWIDDPCRKFVGLHRQFRHDAETIELVEKLFGEKYGILISANIALDHIMLDHEETMKERREKSNAIVSEKVLYEVEKPKYEKKKEDLRRMLRISEIKTSNIRDYIQVKYANKKEDLLDAVIAALLDWEKYCFSRQNSNSNIERKDMTGYIIDLKKRVKPRTAAYYLGFLVPYLKHEALDDLAIYVNDKKKEFVKEFKKADKNIEPMPENYILTLYRSVKTRERILIRLLLFAKDIQIKSLDKISFIKTSKGEYQFNVDGKIINNMDEETRKLAEQFIQENNLKDDEPLLGIVSRTIEENMEKLVKIANLPYDIAPMDLRKYGKTHNKTELMDKLNRII